MQKFLDYAVDNQGNAVGTASVRVKNAGSAVDATIYSDDGITPLTNPFSVESDGSYYFYAENGVYDVVVTAAGYTFDADDTAGLRLYDVSDGLLATGTTTPRSLAVRFADLINVQDYGAVPGGTIDATNAFQSAIDAAGSGGFVTFAGLYKITGTLTLGNRIHLKGYGPYASRLNFAPTADDTLIEVTEGASVVNQGSLSDFAITSDDTTYTKVGIDLIDSSGYRVENIVIGGSVQVGSSFYWSGGSGSIGIRTKGREFAQIKSIYNYADRPLVISKNPNSTLDIDHFHFQDLYLVSNTTYNCVTIDDGVNLTNVEFDGSQSWVLGAHGLYWLDTTASVISNNLRIRGLRTEQGTDAAAYSIYISRNADLQHFRLEDSYLDAARKGIYLRMVKDPRIESTNYGGTLEAFNAVAESGFTLDIDSCFFQVGSTATLTNYLLYDSIADELANKPIPNTAHYVYAASGFQPSQRRRIPVLTTANLPAAGAAEDGLVVIEDVGAGDRNLILYAGGQRFRIDGGTNF